MRTDPSLPARDVRSEDSETIGLGVWTGITPLIWLVGIVGLAIAGDGLARALATPTGFFIWRRIVESTFAVGLVIAAIVYGVATFRALRLAAAWRRAGLARQAAGAYWTLFAAALMVLAPVILALALPQHPAP